MCVHADAGISGTATWSLPAGLPTLWLWQQVLWKEDGCPAGPPGERPTNPTAQFQPAPPGLCSPLPRSPVSPEHWPGSGPLCGEQIGDKTGDEMQGGRPGAQVLTYPEGLASWGPRVWGPGEWDVIADTPAGSGAARGLRGCVAWTWPSLLGDSDHLVPIQGKLHSL